MKFSLQLVLLSACLTVVTLVIWSWRTQTQELLIINHPVATYTSLIEHSEIVCTTVDKKKDALSLNVTKPKVILFHQFPDFYELNSASGFTIFESCGKKCELTTKISRYQESDMVIFYSDCNMIHNAGSTIPVKNPDQVWVFFSVESPENSGNSHFGKPSWHGLFNWTMTYRYDSEFWHGYLRTARRSKPVPTEKRVENEKEWRDVFKKKTKMVAWFVSHCNTSSAREKYAAELSKYIQVDIYGSCGTLKCDHNAKCMEMVRKDYMFYLSFENSFCMDYVTEKLLKVYVTGAVVPVVRGGADYQKLFPDNSLVDASQFDSPKSLAKHLKTLASDEDAYIKLLQWTWDYEISGPSMPLCQLCERVNMPGHMSCYYKNIYKWWKYKMCYKPHDF